ncbi:MAG: S8 family serine peptidase [Rhodospirillales bacterium]|nr:S8 family serine peptidase [Rhodospirillales bacterium]
MRHFVLVTLCAALVLTGCAGGDRRAGMPDPDPPRETEDDERRDRLAARYRADPAFGRQWGLGRIGADQAHARLAMQHGEDARAGSGVTVGILDSGIDEDHPAFAGTRIDEVFLPGATNERGVLPSHGTAVASVVAGGRGSGLPDGAQGVAPGADLAVFAFGTDTEPPPEPEPDLPTEYFPEWSYIIDEIDEDNAAELRTVLDWREDGRRVEFLNLSFGSFGIIDGYTETELRSVYDRTIATIAQQGVEEKTVFVWAAATPTGSSACPTNPNVWPAAWPPARRATRRGSRRGSPNSEGTPWRWWR